MQAAVVHHRLLDDRRQGRSLDLRRQELRSLVVQVATVQLEVSGEEQDVRVRKLLLRSRV
jgi:hypothetical protein